MTTAALLAHLKTAQLPLTLTDPDSIRALGELKSLGLVDAVIGRPSRSRNDYGTVRCAVVKRLLR